MGSSINSGAKPHEGDLWCDPPSPDSNPLLQHQAVGLSPCFPTKVQSSVTSMDRRVETDGLFHVAPDSRMDRSTYSGFRVDCTIPQRWFIWTPIYKTSLILFSFVVIYSDTRSLNPKIPPRLPDVRLPLVTRPGAPDQARSRLRRGRGSGGYHIITRHVKCHLLNALHFR